MADVLGIGAPVDGAPKQKDTSPGATEVSYWMSQIHEALKRDKNWRELAKKLFETYEAETDRGQDYNIIYANTEILLPACYSATPRPRVKPRLAVEANKLPPPDSKLRHLAAKAVENLLTFQTDTGSPNYSTFDSLMQSATREGLVGGMGITIFSYDPYFEKAPAPAAPGEAESEGEDAAESYSEEPEGSDPVKLQEDGEPAGQELTPSQVPAPPPQKATEKVKSERICGVPLQFERFCWGYAETWGDVPWLGIEYRMTKADLKKNFGAKAKDIQLDFPKNEKGETEKDKPAAASVWAVWHKSSRKVLLICEGYPQGVLKRLDDPLELEGFFPIPEPMVFFRKRGTLCPVPLYKFYEKQAKELDLVSKRITKIVTAIKARGFYDASIKDIEKMMESEDTVFTPAKGIAALQGKNLEQAIWVWPVEKLVQVLQQLYLQRTQIKSVIFEITGLSDIIRGSTAASETLGAQQLKNQWGTLRLRLNQKTVSVYARNCFRIMAEIAINHFQEETWERMTCMGLPTSAEKAQAERIMRELQSQPQMPESSGGPLAAAFGPPSPPQGPGMPPGGMPPRPMAPPSMMPPGAPGPSAGPPPIGPPPTSLPGAPAPQGPPPPSPPMGPPSGGPPMSPGPTGSGSPSPGASAGPPPVSPMQQQLQATLSKPSWGEVLSILKDDTTRNFLIDIQTNSTLDADATEDKQDLTEMFGSISQIFQGMTPMVEKGVIPLGVFKGFLLGATERYRFGDEAAEAIRAMPDQLPQQGGGDPKAAAEADSIKQKAAAEAESTRMKLQLEREKMDMEREKMAWEKEEAAKTHQINMAKLNATMQENSAKAAARQQKQVQDQAFAQRQHEMRMMQPLPAAGQPQGGGGAPV